MSNLSVNIHLNDFSQVKSLVQSGIGVLEGFSKLIDYCETRYPDTTWDGLRKIEIRSDIEYLRCWLKLVLTDQPPSENIKAFYFGIYNPIRLGQASCDMYISGSTTFDLQDSNWACQAAGSYWPKNRDSNSRVLHEIYTTVKDTEVASCGEYVLCLGYACLVVKAIFDPPLPVPVAVGFDNGDMILVGS